MTREMSEIEFVQTLLQLRLEDRQEVFDQIKDQLKAGRGCDAELPRGPQSKVS